MTSQPPPDPYGQQYGQSSPPPPASQPQYGSGYQQSGYQQSGYQQPGYQQPGYQQPGYQQPGYQQQGYPPPGQPGGGYPPPGGGTNTMAILSLVLAFVFWPAGIVCGHIAKKQIAERGEEGSGLATAGLVLSYVFGGLVVLSCCLFVGLGVLSSGSSSV